MTPRRRLTGPTAVAVALALAVTGCSAIPSTDPTATTTSASTSSSSTSVTAQEAGSLYDASTVHEITVEVDDAEYEAMIATYLASGDKEWISGTVTIDGQTFEDVGLKLKGNSSLRGISASTDPTTLPWRIRLDKYVDGQELDGQSDLVVRSNTTETSLNEAVALDLLAAAGLASEPSVAAAFSVNGGEPELRLVLQFMDDAWAEVAFGTTGILYKAEADGDYSYRGTDPAAYEDVFDLEAGEEDYTPLIEFLEFLDTATDEEFAEQLPEYLDVDQFARYLAFQDLIANTDDIDGPGNNSYLWWDASTGVVEVVAWDHNLAFGVMGRGGAGGDTMGGGPRGELPEGMEPPERGEGMEPPGLPEGAEPPERGEGQGPRERTDGQEPLGWGDGQRAEGGTGPMGRSNVLVERFTADAGYAALYADAAEALQTELVDSGLAQQIIDARAQVLLDRAEGLVTEDEVAADVAQIESVLGLAAEG